MAIIKRPIPKVYNYLGNKMSELHSAFSIIESGSYGAIPELSFQVPRFLIDGNGNTVYENGSMVIDTRIYTLQNEYLVEFDEDFYVIKYVEDGRDNDNKLFTRVQCKGKAIDLSYKQIPYINLTPPVNLPVDANRGILEVITYPYQVELGYGFIVSSSGNTLTLPVNVGTHDYTNAKIVTLDGAGKNQQRKIVSYNTSTRVATLSSAFSIALNSTTLFRIHNSKYDLGYVDPSLINDGVSNIFRALKFEDVSVLDALNSIATKFVGNLTFTTEFSSVYSEFRTSVGLRLPNVYNNYEFRYKKNMKGVKRTVDSNSGCYTRVYPEGLDNLSISSTPTSMRTDFSPTGDITYAEHTLGKGDIFNFKYYLAQGYTLAQCRDLFVKDFPFIEDSYSDANMLFNGGKRALEEASLPKITYEVDGIDLNIISPSIMSIPLKKGDTVRVVDEDLGLSFYATINYLSREYDRPQAPRFSLSNISDNLGDLYYKILKYNEAYSKRKSLYGKGVSVIIADQATSKNWRYADYIVPTDKTKTATQIIQSAIDYVSSIGGGAIILSAGTYEISNTIALKSNIELMGEGVSTRLIPSSSTVNICMSATGVSNIVIGSLFIDFVKSPTNTVERRFATGIGIYSSSNNITIDNITHEYTSSNMVIAISSSNITVRNSTFKSTTVNFSGSDGVDVKGCANFTCENNRFLGWLSPQNKGMVAVVDQVGVTTGSVNIKDNYFDMTGGGYCIIYVSSTTDVIAKVSNNTILYKGSSYFGSAIYLRGRHGDVIDNVVVGNFSYGIYTNTSELDATMNVLGNNVTMNASTTNTTNFDAMIVIGGYERKGVGNAQGNNVKRGNVYNSTMASPAYGIKIEPGCTGAVCANNDASLSGVTSSILNQGVGTLTLGGNKQ